MAAWFRVSSGRKKKAPRAGSDIFIYGTNTSRGLQATTLSGHIIIFSGLCRRPSRSGYIDSISLFSLNLSPHHDFITSQTRSLNTLRQIAVESSSSPSAHHLPLLICSSADSRRARRLTEDSLDTTLFIHFIPSPRRYYRPIQCSVSNPNAKVAYPPPEAMPKRFSPLLLLLLLLLLDDGHENEQPASQQSSRILAGCQALAAAAAAATVAGRLR